MQNQPDLFSNFKEITKQIWKRKGFKKSVWVAFWANPGQQPRASPANHPRPPPLPFSIFPFSFSFLSL
jgi:hypothetical protein